MIKGYNFSRCENPRLITNRYTGERIEIPCGCCRACSLRRRDKMITLCETEQAKHRFTMFVTLTFDPEHLPLIQPIRQDKRNLHGYRFYNLCHRYQVLGSKLHFEHDSYHKSSDWLDIYFRKVKMPYIPYVSVRDAQLFLKRFRKILSFYSDEKIRYYCVSEYGPVHFRPHLHLLLFYDEEKTNKYIGRAIRLGWAYRYRKTIKYKQAYVRPFKTRLYKECTKSVFKLRKFGRVHYELTKSSATSYCAKYVNCSVSLPRFYSFLSFLRPFSLHSKNFGYPLPQGIKKEIYEDDSFGFSEVSEVKNGRISTRELQNTFKSRFYPKCRGFKRKNFGELLQTYTIYSQVRQYYKVDSVSRLANLVWFDLHQNLNHVGTNYFKTLLACPDYLRFNLDPEHDRLFLNRLQSDLYLSKHFVIFCCDDDCRNYHLRVKQILDFWRYEEKKKLKQFYLTQEEYVRDYPNNLDYLPFMYGNFTDYFVSHYNEIVDDIYDSYISENFQDYCEHVALQMFSLNGHFKDFRFVPNMKLHSMYNNLQTDTLREFEFSIKHKIQNDLNNKLKNL